MLEHGALHNSHPSRSTHWDPSVMFQNSHDRSPAADTHSMEQMSSPQSPQVVAALAQFLHAARRPPPTQACCLSLLLHHCSKHSSAGWLGAAAPMPQPPRTSPHTHQAASKQVGAAGSWAHNRAWVQAMAANLPCSGSGLAAPSASSTRTAAHACHQTQPSQQPCKCCKVAIAGHAAPCCMKGRQRTHTIA